MFEQQLQQQFSVGASFPYFEVIRTQAWKEFQKKGLPNKKKSGFEYLPLEAMYKETFSIANGTTVVSQEDISQFIYPECSNSCIVVVDGKFHKSLSRLQEIEKLSILSLEEASKTYGNYLKGKWQVGLDIESCPFSVLNLAMIDEGLFIFVPKATHIQAPIQILHLVTGPNSIHPRVVLHAGSCSQTQFIHKTVFLQEKAAFVNETIEIALENQAICEYIETPLMDFASHYYLSASKVAQKQDSKFTGYHFTNGSKLVRKDYKAWINGENAEADIRGLSVLSDKAQAHIFANVIHKMPHATSNQHFKSILDDKARFSFEGKIYVEKQAQLTQAYQLNNNLLLSDQAICYSKPNLEIFADDVKASHGSTTADISDEELFYLQSRGLSHRQAQELLIGAFAKEFLQRINVLSIADACKRYTAW